MTTRNDPSYGERMADDPTDDRTGASTAAPETRDTTDPADPVQDVVIPALLRAARGTYGQAIRDQLSAAGCDDLPRNGAFVLEGWPTGAARRRT